ncbi:hypothetical protein BB934_45505 (plasmid) [Microvirga ossetica]|uniref:Uncharacterized protein n=1 Tax=Microvirga ossetica TaxID=1882682 RepID=A0A1B2EZQ6_9HYPH|nr:hypothetical protein [Microvirga ossetica]ANY85479.1 hypothetical protein BB934_45505 [Microvirga ossetica]
MRKKNVVKYDWLDPNLIRYLVKPRASEQDIDGLMRIEGNPYQNDAARQQMLAIAEREVEPGVAREEVTAIIRRWIEITDPNHKPRRRRRRWG